MGPQTSGVEARHECKETHVHLRRELLGDFGSGGLSKVWHTRDQVGRGNMRSRGPRKREQAEGPAESKQAGRKRRETERNRDYQTSVAAARA